MVPLTNRNRTGAAAFIAQVSRPWSFRSRYLPETVASGDGSSGGAEPAAPMIVAWIRAATVRRWCFHRDRHNVTWARTVGDPTLRIFPCNEDFRIVNKRRAAASVAGSKHRALHDLMALGGEAVDLEEWNGRRAATGWPVKCAEWLSRSVPLREQSQYRR